MRLNEEQRKALLHDEGPAMVVAGAGTGKTAVITGRIARLITQGKALPGEILALTFTEKAAGEMEERVERSLPSSYAYSDFRISTFHSFGERLLREHGLEIGLPAGFGLLEETGAWMLVRRNLDRFKLDHYRPAGNPAKFIAAMVSHFSRCKDEMISPEDYLRLAKRGGPDAKRLKEIASAYRHYQDLLLEKGYLDFGDLIGYSAKLLKERPSILNQCRDRFKYLVVDEFQDTNRAQYEILRLISEPKKNIFVCFDGNQAIYRWRGASSGNVAEFERDHPEAKKVFLSKNYRSLQNILDLTHDFINFGSRIDSDRLKAVRKGKGRIDHLHFRSMDRELTGIANEVSQLMKGGRCRPDEIAVLTRTNGDAEAITAACERVGIPCRFLSMKGLYRKSVVLDAISYFKLLDNYHESSAVYRILNLPFLGISPREIAKMTQHGYRKGTSIYSVLLDASSVPGLLKGTVKKVSRLTSMVEEHSLLAARKGVSEILISFLEDSKYLNHLNRTGDLEAIDHVNQFFDRIKRFETSNPGARLRDFMEELTLEIDSGESGALDPGSDEDGSVKVMTVHSAKGLEFKHVVIANMVDLKFPGIGRKDPIEIPKELSRTETSKDDHLMEERRLFYVAMTRAKDGLVFTSAEDYGGSRKRKISRFLAELGFCEKPFSELQDLRSKKKIERKKSVPTPPKHLSFTQLAAYSKCPLQYKYAHIMKIPVRSKPSLVFGRSMHDALFLIVKEEIERKVTVNEALDLFDSVWSNDWYESKTQRDEYHKSGKKAVREFIREFRNGPPSVARINDIPALEHDFRFDLQGHVIKGKIDRIDKTGKGFEIIDYKTGAARSTLDPEERDQLIIYQMAIESLFGMEVEKLTYHYLTEGKKLSFKADKKGKERAVERVVTKARSIGEGLFDPDPGWHCRHCDFNEICEHAKS